MTSHQRSWFRVVENCLRGFSDWGPWRSYSWRSKEYQSWCPGSRHSLRLHDQRTIWPYQWPGHSEGNLRRSIQGQWRCFHSKWNHNGSSAQQVQQLQEKMLRKCTRYLLKTSHYHKWVERSRCKRCPKSWCCEEVVWIPRWFIQHSSYNDSRWEHRLAEA